MVSPGIFATIFLSILLFSNKKAWGVWRADLALLWHSCFRDLPGKYVAGPAICSLPPLESQAQASGAASFPHPFSTEVCNFYDITGLMFSICAPNLVGYWVSSRETAGVHSCPGLVICHADEPGEDGIAPGGGLTSSSGTPAAFHKEKFPNLLLVFS